MKPLKSMTRTLGYRSVPALFASILLGVTAAQAGPTLTYGEEGFVTLDYSIQAWVQNRGYTSSTDSGSTTDFFLRRNRITLAGQYNDYVGFYTQIEATSDGKGGQNDRSIYFRDAYVTLDVNDGVRFIVGRFKNTFTRENLEACLEPLTLDRGEVLVYTPFGGTRDTGVAMWGNLLDAKIQYRVMIADGREGDEVAQDSPRMTARLHWSLLDPEYDYGYRGTYLGTRKVLTLGVAYDRQDKVAYADWNNRRDAKDYKAWTADIFFEYPTTVGAVTASAAYMDYSVGDAINQAPDPTLPVNSELSGGYLKLGFLLPGKQGIGRLQLFTRHEKLDYGISNGYYDNTWNSIGANYYISGQQLKVSFEYAKIDYKRQHPTVAALRDYNQATLGLQLIF
ncbi:phosphate-selective porin O and P [hydrothermal vent metagenome]|uniref:Phosphate-selective porin O and P n=1 Tax=hydrothermal vent metagenome TaxID=652676 RepID=A0A3B0Z4G0_9ZZZZ